MKRPTIYLQLFSFVTLLCLLAITGFAQNRERHVISAKAGAVNSVVGRVMVSKVGMEPQLLTSQDDLSAGDTVETGINSQAEILLNPGSYLRLGDDSRFTLVDNSLDRLLVKLVKGSMIIEATGPDDARFQIRVTSGDQNLTIIRSGIYRFNVTSQSSELLVRKGRVMLRNGQLIKGGNKVTFANGSFVAAKLDKHDTDTFDLWSKQRADMLAQANRKLSNRTLSGYLSRTWGWGYFGRTPWGLWTYSPFTQCYTFLPFYYGWSSPYGHYYDHYFYGGGMPGGWPTGSSSGGPIIVRGSGSGGGSSGGSSGGSGSGSSTSGGTFGSPSPSQSIRSAPVDSPRGVDTAPRPVERIRVP